MRGRWSMRRARSRMRTGRRTVARVLFSMDVDGNQDMYVVNSDGSDLQRLTDHPATDQDAALVAGRPVDRVHFRPGERHCRRHGRPSQGATPGPSPTDGRRYIRAVRRVRDECGRQRADAGQPGLLAGQRSGLEAARPMRLAVLLAMARSWTGIIAGCGGGDAGYGNLIFIARQSGDYTIRLPLEERTSRWSWRGSLPWDSAPVWSPDGTQDRLLQRPGVRPDELDDNVDIYVMNADGSDMTAADGRPEAGRVPGLVARWRAAGLLQRARRRRRDLHDGGRRQRRAAADQTATASTSRTAGRRTGRSCSGRTGRATSTSGRWMRTAAARSA